MTGREAAAGEEGQQGRGERGASRDPGRPGSGLTASTASLRPLTLPFRASEAEPGPCEGRQRGAGCPLMGPVTKQVPSFPLEPKQFAPKQMNREGGSRDLGAVSGVGSAAGSEQDLRGG